jgi:hypothetical protein
MIVIKEGPDTQALTPVTKRCFCSLAKKSHYHFLYYEAAGAPEMDHAFSSFFTLLAGIFIISVSSHWLGL